MAKIVLDSVVSGYNLGKINENFQKIEDALNDEVLYRDNPPGETNTVKQDVDMDGNSIINVGDLQVGGTFTVDGINFDGVNSAFIWRGAWSNLTAYAISDAVSYDGSSYICITAHTGSTPPSANWDLLAAKGVFSVASTDISDSTATGRALITTASPSTARATLEVPPRATRIDVASVAGTVDLTTNAPDTDDIRITGALVITAFTVAVGRVIRITAGGAFTLTNNANIVTQTGANIVCAAGDTFVLRATAANTVEVLNYVYAGIVPGASITPSKLSQPFTLGTPVTTTGGVAVDITGIPSWVSEVTVFATGVSTNGSSGLIVQSRAAGVPETSGYVSNLDNNVTPSLVTTGFGLFETLTSGNTYMFDLTLKRFNSSNTWVAVGACGDTGGAQTIRRSIGTKTLAGVLDGIRLTTVGGGNTFDVMSLNVNYK